jgi:hypothetical protein
MMATGMSPDHVMVQAISSLFTKSNIAFRPPVVFERDPAAHHCGGFNLFI